MADDPKPEPNRGNAGKGRPKGSRNKMTTIAREAIAAAFDRLEGVDGLVNWVEADPKNKSCFYLTIYPKLLPLQVNADVNARIIARVVFKGLNG